MGKRAVIRIEDLHAISVNDIARDGYWIRANVNGHRYLLRHEMMNDREVIRFYVDDVYQTYWLLYVRPLRGGLRNGGRIPPDSAVRYVLDCDFRMRYLYLSKAGKLGTRISFRAKNSYCLKSHRQQKRYKEMMAVKHGKHRRRVARKKSRWLEGVKDRLRMS